MGNMQFIGLLSIDKELSLYLTSGIQFRRPEMMIAQIRQFGTVGWFFQLLGGCFHQESDHPAFLSFGNP